MKFGLVLFALLSLVFLVKTNSIISADSSKLNIDNVVVSDTWYTDNSVTVKVLAFGDYDEIFYKFYSPELGTYLDWKIYATEYHLDGGNWLVTTLSFPETLNDISSLNFEVHAVTVDSNQVIDEYALDTIQIVQGDNPYKIESVIVETSESDNESVSSGDVISSTSTRDGSDNNVSESTVVAVATSTVEVTPSTTPTATAIPAPTGTPTVISSSTGVSKLEQELKLHISRLQSRISYIKSYQTRTRYGAFIQQAKLRYYYRVLRAKIYQLRELRNRY